MSEITVKKREKKQKNKLMSALEAVPLVFAPSGRLGAHLIRHVLRVAHQTVLDHFTPLSLPQTVEGDHCLIQSRGKSVSPAGVTGILNATSPCRCA